jgi:hypothetical protein
MNNKIRNGPAMDVFPVKIRTSAIINNAMAKPIANL